MAKLPPSPFWSANSQIPIYLDPADKDEKDSPEEGSHHICPTCAISSRDQPIHCVSHSSHASPAPPSYRSVVSQPTPGRLAVPELNIITSPRQSRPQAPRPALQFDPEGRPQLRFRRNAFSPLSPSVAKREDIDWNRGSHIGLGIPEAQFRPDATPITPGTVEKEGGQKSDELQGASNFAQRIEQRLWKYSASGNVLKRWLIEIISWILSAVCMAGIIGMLFYYKDKRIPKWPLGLTLNAYISVLSKVASAALLLPTSEALGQLKWSWFQGDNSKKMWDFEIFDNASRGPWGSLLLLVRTKGRSLAALGAAVTLFALALDPFFQQVVEYPERWRLQEGTGSIPRAITYKPYLSGNVYRLGQENIELDQKLLGVAYNFFYDTGAAPVTFGKGVRAEVPLACPSSNCTWPEYETFGVCNECADASHQLEFKCLNTTMDWVQMPESDQDGTVFPNGTSCGWWLKSDDNLLMTGYNVDVDTAHSGEVLMVRTQPLYDINTREVLPGYTATLNNSRNPLSHVIIASGQHLDDIQRNATPIAHECIVSWCSKRMSSTYSEGGYSETIISTVTNNSVSRSPWETRPIIRGNEVLDAVEYFYFEDVVVIGESGQRYTIDNKTHVITLALFDDMFPSTYTLINSTDEKDAMLRYKQYVTVMPYTRNMTYNPYLYPNITDHMDKMATAITNLIRSTRSNTEDFTGPAFEQESFVDVRWVWLSLPLSLLGLTFLFLVATVIRSSMEQEQVGVWKTSAIATLLYGLPDDMQKKITSSKSNGTPRAKAKEIKLKWLPKSGWRFSANSVLSPLTAKARQTMSSTASDRSPMYLAPPSPRLSDTTLAETASLKSPISTPNFGTISRAPSVKSFSSSPTLECPSTSPSLKSPPTPPPRTTLVSPPASPFEPSFPTPPLGSCTPSPPFAIFNHPSPLASNPSLPLESPRNTQTYFERNPSAYYKTSPQINLEPNAQASTQASTQTNIQPNIPSNLQPNLQLNHQENRQASPPANLRPNPGANPPTGSPPPIIPFVRSHARRPSKPRYPTPPPGWI